MSTGLDLALFIVGGTIAIIALLADFSRSRMARAVPIPHRTTRALFCVVGIVLASIPFLPSGSTAPSPDANTPTAATPPATNAAASRASDARRPTPSIATSQPLTSELNQTQPKLSMNNTDQVVVKDAEGIKATPREVTVHDLPDSVVRELLKRHPVPIEPDFSKGSAGAAGTEANAGN